jgi:hypothetical protein
MNNALWQFKKLTDSKNFTVLKVPLQYHLAQAMDHWLRKVKLNIKTGQNSFSMNVNVKNVDCFTFM